MIGIPQSIYLTAAKSAKLSQIIINNKQKGRSHIAHRFSMVSYGVRAQRRQGIQLIQRGLGGLHCLHAGIDGAS